MNALHELVKKTERLAIGFEALPMVAVKAAADVVEASINRQIGNDAPRRRVAGGTVGVKQKVIRTGQDPAILMTEAGPLHLLSNPTSPHQITSRPAGSRRRHRAVTGAAIAAGAVAMRTPYGPKYRVNHPGTRGKHTWQQGVEQARPLITATVQARYSTEIRGLFR